MGDREVPFDEEAKCDICGEIGAWDFMGDFICQDCMDFMEESADEGKE